MFHDVDPAGGLPDSNPFKSGLKFAFTRQTIRMQKIILFLVGCLSGLLATAQLQLGVFGGLSNYQGDLTDKLYKNSKGAFGITAGYQLSNRINLRAGITIAGISGADSLTKQDDLKLRNLSFQSPIHEFSLIGEFNSFDMSVKRWSPYVFAGIAIYRFNPYTYDRNGNKVFLQPLSTEGQGLPGYSAKPYGRTQLALPFGGGIKYNISEKIRLALEVGLRKTFTDYLDDVSGNYADPMDLLNNKGQLAYDLSYRGDELPGGDPTYPTKGDTRGGSKYKDYYYFSGLHISYLFGEGSAGGKGKGRKGYGCPTVF